MARFILTVYWSNGKQEWENWHTAQGLGNQRFMQAEDVNVDDVVHQGPVAGLGDAAYFSELLPSLLLKGEVLFEINLKFHAARRDQVRRFGPEATRQSRMIRLEQLQARDSQLLKQPRFDGAFTPWRLRR